MNEVEEINVFAMDEKLQEDGTETVQLLIDRRMRKVWQWKMMKLDILQLSVFFASQMNR